MNKFLRILIPFLLGISTIHLSAQTQTLRLKPLVSSDDAEQNMGTGSVQLNSSDLELGGYDWGLIYKQMTGVRFPNVTLPQGATISKAYIQFSVDELYAGGNTANITIKAQKGNAATYAATANNISSRTYTTASVNWATSAWTVLDQRLAAQQTPDLKALLIEAMQTGFASGNALAFNFTTTVNGYATAYAFDRGAANAPELVIEYTTAPPLSITADKTSGTYYEPFNIVLTGTAGSTIRYTTDGSTPTATTGLVYSAPIAVSATSTIKAIAVSGTSVSSVLTLSYNFAPLSISADKASGVYYAPFSVVLTGTAGTTIRYTTDGSTPTATTGTLYSAPIAVNAATTIKAISVLNSTISSVLSLNYTFQTVNNIKTTRYKIAASSDDAEENTASGAVVLNSSDLELGGFDIGQNFAQVVGIRFGNIALPANAIITKAYIQFSAKETSQTPLANIDIKIQNATNAATFAATAKNITSRTFTSGKTVWNTQKWLLANDRTALQQSPDISGLLKEAMTSGGWNANMSFVLTLGSATSGWANAFSFDGNNANAPELVIEYGEKPIERTLLTNVFINEATGSNTLNRNLDWIEVLNNNTAIVSLDSVYLTDDKKTPNKYMFPKGSTLAPKSFLTVNADDTLTVPTATAGAFGISASGETVYMFQHFNGVLYQIDSLNVGATIYNTSWGRSPDASGNVIKFVTPTPSVSNNSSKQLVDLTFSHTRGIQAAAFNLTITAPAGMTIRYTTNGSLPNATTGTVYTAPIAVNQNMIFKVFAYDATRESKVTTQTYIINSGLTSASYTQQQLNDALKDLPIVCLGTTASDANGTEAGCSFEFINKFGENKSTFVDAGFRIFGNTSKGYPKKNYRVYFRSQYGYNKLKHKVYEKSSYEGYAPTDEFDALDLKAGTDFMPPGSSYWGLGGLMMSDYMAHELLRRMGNKDIHARFVHMFFNGKYYGLYVLRERFNQNYMKSYYGGEDTEYEVIDGTYESSTWPVGITSQGTGTQWAETKQVATTNFQELKKKVDMKQYIDMMLEFFFTDMEHEYRAAAHKGYQKTKFVIMHNDTDGFLTPTNEGGHNFVYKLDNQSALGPGNITTLAGIQGSTANLEYRTMVRDRVQDLYINSNGLITTTGLTKLINESRDIIYNSAMLETTRWNFYTRDAWSNRVNAIINSFPSRLTTVLNFFRGNNWVHTLQAPTFSKASGSLNIGEKIYLTNPNAGTTMYYTTDGTDVVFDNGISPTAKLYNATAGIDLPLGKTKIRARAFATANFGMYADAEYVVSRPIKITAIAYQPNPAAPAAEPKGSDVYEFFHLTNIGTSAVDVSNFMVTEAIDTFRLPVGTSIAGGETIMLCSDDTKYPSVQMRKFKWTKGKLANEGENISFRDNFGNLVNEVKYDTLTPWPYAKGNGLYIRLKSLTADNSKGGNWEAVSLTDLNPPILLQNVGNFTATPQGNTANLTWTNPTTAFDEILIVAKEVSSITTKPDAATTYTADANFTGAGTAFGGGKIIYKGIGNAALITNLNYGKTYYFKAFTKKGTTYTEGVEIIATMPPLCDASGQLLCEIWNNIGAGNCVTDIPVTTTPTKSQVLPLAYFETVSNQAEAFGARFRGYICAPETGNYTFYIASDDGGELWLSTDATAANKRKIAFMPNCGWVAPRNWTGFVEQKSVSIALVAGQKYYVEALYKEGGGGDNLAVGWQIPSNPTVIDVVPGNLLSPFVTTAQNLQSQFVFTAEGHQEGGKAVLNWISNANRNVDYYVVEKLESNKTEFEQLEIVNAQYSNQEKELHYYTLTDNNPPKGEVVYRVGMVLEGQATPQYAAPIALNFAHFADYGIYPNPATDVVTIDLSKDLNLATTVSLVDLTGKIILEQAFERAPQSLNIDLTAYSAGQYFIKIKTQGKREVMKKVAITK